MQKVLGVDLGSHWKSIGTAILAFDAAGWIACKPEAIAFPKTACSPASIADQILSFALQSQICAISLDGPQGWRDPATQGRFVGRECERLTRTPGKTGTFGVAKPRTWVEWIRCSIEVFDRLLSTGRADLANAPDVTRLSMPPVGKFWLLECFPTSTWRQAGLRPLPGHSADLLTMQRAATALKDAFALPEMFSEGIREAADHDNLQAVVAALPAAALVGGPCRAVPSGLPATVIDAREDVPAHRAEGIIWDAEPCHWQSSTSDTRELRLATRSPHGTAPAELEPRGKLCQDESGVRRGVLLFRYLADAANRGDAVGISYGAFIAYVNGASAFRDVSGRAFLPSDAMTAVRLAWAVTKAAGGRIQVHRSGTTIEAGMDSFVWNANRPFGRPDGAWGYSLPYTRSQWLSVFPDGARRLITPKECQLLGPTVRNDLT